MADSYINSERNETTGGGKTKKNYDDEEIRRIEIVNIYNYTDEDGAGAWENIFRSLRDGITKEGMVQLISLACHIQNREGEPLMKRKSTDHTTQTVTNKTYLIRARTRFAAHARVQESIGVNQDEEGAQSKFKAICYFAACLMRLVCKPPDNFMRSLAKIKNQYLKLYGAFSPYLASLHFKRPMAEHISLAFRLFPLFKHTIAHHVAFADAEHRENRHSLGILRFACVQHLEFYGMTAYPQYVDLINYLKLLSPGLYRTWLRCPDNNPALDMIHHINLNYDPPKEGSTPSRFWKYARIFDSGYFWELEPKSCKYLLATQAHLTIHYGLRTGPEGYQSPLNVPAIRDDNALLSSAKLMADEFVKAYQNLELHLNQQGPIGPIWRRLHKDKVEIADDYIRTFNILCVHSDQAGPLWRSINRCKTDNKQFGGAIKRPRIQDARGTSNIITITPAET